MPTTRSGVRVHLLAGQHGSPSLRADRHPPRQAERRHPRPLRVRRDSRSAVTSPVAEPVEHHVDDDTQRHPSRWPYGSYPTNPTAPIEPSLITTGYPAAPAPIASPDELRGRAPPLPSRTELRVPIQRRRPTAPGR